MGNRMWTFAPLLLGLLAAGCSRPADLASALKLQVGQATPRDAEALLGKPDHVRRDPNGDTRLTWEASTHSYVGGGTVTSLRMTFGPDGKLLAQDCTTLVQPPVLHQEPGGGCR